MPRRIAKRSAYPWKTLEDVAQVLRRRHNAGKPVSFSALKRGSYHERRLVRFVTDKLGRPWKHALVAANLEDQEVERNYPWQGSLEKVVERVKELSAGGVSAHGRDVLSQAGTEMYSIYQHVKGQLKVPWSLVQRSAGVTVRRRSSRVYPWRADLEKALERIRYFHQKTGAKLTTAFMRAGPGERKLLYLHFTRRLKVAWHDALAHAGLNPFEHLPRTPVPSSPAVVLFLHQFVRRKLVDEGEPGHAEYWQKEFPQEFAALEKVKIDGRAFAGHRTWYDYVRNHHNWPLSRIQRLRFVQIERHGSD